MINLIEIGNDRSTQPPSNYINLGDHVIFISKTILYDEDTEKEVGLIKRLNTKDDIPTGFRNLCREVILNLSKESKFYDTFIKSCLTRRLDHVVINQSNGIKYVFDSCTWSSRIAVDPIDLMLEFFMDICYMWDDYRKLTLGKNITYQRYNEDIEYGKIIGYTFPRWGKPCNVLIRDLNSKNEVEINFRDIISA